MCTWLWLFNWGIGVLISSRLGTTALGLRYLAIETIGSWRASNGSYFCILLRSCHLYSDYRFTNTNKAVSTRHSEICLYSRTPPYSRRDKPSHDSAHTRNTVAAYHGTCAGRPLLTLGIYKHNQKNRPFLYKTSGRRLVNFGSNAKVAVLGEPATDR